MGEFDGGSWGELRSKLMTGLVTFLAGVGVLAAPPSPSEDKYITEDYITYSRENSTDDRRHKGPSIKDVRTRRGRGG